jgi:diaminopimelate epimerase
VSHAASVTPSTADAAAATRDAAGFAFVKGHGTENDFLLLPDPDGTVHGDLDAGLVAALCDRRAGIGADGVMRVVRTTAYDDPASVAARGEAEWFMDYRNADGSLSEMCGNGVRVFARYLADQEGVDTSRPLAIGTRAGVKLLSFEPDGRITADMGEPRLLGATEVGVGDRTWPAVHVSMGNPHAVAFVDALEDAGPLLEPPTYDVDVYPQGTNVEFVVRRGERHVAMRVHERGSGETRSCGTGACAVMVAAAVADDARPRSASGQDDGLASSYRVDVPGGTLTVTWTPEDRVLLTGPAVLVAEGSAPKSLASA